MSIFITFFSKKSIFEEPAFDVILKEIKSSTNENNSQIIFHCP